MDRDTRRWLVKVGAIVLSAAVVTWIANAPLPDREIRRVEPAVDARLAALAPETREQIRTRVFDGLVSGLRAAGLDAGWQLEDSGRVVLGGRSESWPTNWALRLGFGHGGVGDLIHEEIVVERWIPLWPAEEERAAAQALAQDLVEAHRAAVRSDL